MVVVREANNRACLAIHGGHTVVDSVRSFEVTMVIMAWNQNGQHKGENSISVI